MDRNEVCTRLSSVDCYTPPCNTRSVCISQVDQPKCLPYDNVVENWNCHKIVVNVKADLKKPVSLFYYKHENCHQYDKYISAKLIIIKISLYYKNLGAFFHLKYNVLVFPLQ